MFRLRSSSHRGTETRRRRLRALHCDDKRAIAPTPVDGIVVLVISEHAVLHRNGCQVAGSDPEKGIRTLGLRLVVQYAERPALSLRRPQLHICRVQVFLPALRPHCISKKGIILAPFKPVVPRRLLISPTSG